MSEQFEFTIVFTNESTYQEDGFLTGLIHAKFFEDLDNARLFLRPEVSVVFNFELGKKVLGTLPRGHPKLCTKSFVTHRSKFITDLKVNANESREFKFCIYSLPDLLPTFVGQFGFLCYKVSVLVEMPFDKIKNKNIKKIKYGNQDKNNIKCISDDYYYTIVVAHKYYKVASKLNLSFVPEAAKRINITKVKSLGNCFSPKYFKVNWYVDQSGYVRGDVINIVTTVRAFTDCDFHVDETTLYKVVVYNVDYVRQFNKCEVARAVVEKAINKNGDVIVYEQLVIPKDIDCSTTRCKKCWIDIYYEIEFSVTSKSLRKPLVEKAEIYIGSEPLDLKQLGEYLAVTYNLPVRDYYTQSYPPSPVMKLLTRELPTAPPPYTEESSTSPSDFCLVLTPRLRALPNLDPTPDVWPPPDYKEIIANERMKRRLSDIVSIYPRNMPAVIGPPCPPMYD